MKFEGVAFYIHNEESMNQFTEDVDIHIELAMELNESIGIYVTSEYVDDIFDVYAPVIEEAGVQVDGYITSKSAMLNMLQPSL
jgi:hypothetical protein